MNRRTEAHERHQNLSEEEIEKKRQYHRERNKNLSEEQKHKRVEYMRNASLAHKKWLLDHFISFLKLLRQFNLIHGLALEIWKNSEIGV